MSSKPYVTALIDTYNQGSFIDKAIDSVLAQDFPASQIEILVVDDGSTDDTRQRVAKYGDRVRYIYKENGGQASALNCGFAESRGQIVALLDSDDLWMPNKVRRVVEEFEKHPEAVVVSHPNQYWDLEKNVFKNSSDFYPSCGDALLTRESVLQYGNFGTSGITVPAATVRALLPIPETLRIYADTYLVLLFPFLGPVVGIAEQLTRYRIHGSNLTSFASGDSAKKRQRWECYAAAIEAAKSWLKVNGFASPSPNILLHLKRYELEEQSTRFQYQAPDRSEYFQFLRERQGVYGHEWRLPYRVFRSLISFASFGLGYDACEALRKVYRERAGLLNLREALLPASTMQGKPGNLHAGS
ncbi:MAG: glycosyltransferase family 2 protein [Acidipila sp.]|nr:glycosyltransferase family 2 protein [Acidipila sp.]